jgi:hypothetical protein
MILTTKIIHTAAQTSLIHQINQRIERDPLLKKYSFKLDHNPRFVKHSSPVQPGSAQSYPLFPSLSRSKPHQCSLPFNPAPSAVFQSGSTQSPPSQFLLHSYPGYSHY